MAKKTRYQIFGGILLAGALLFNSGNALAEKRIEVNIPSYNLRVYDGDNCVTGFPVRVGRPEAPTPIGQGEIYEKRRDISFFYLDGEKEGEKIEKSFIVPKARFEKMPYEKMRALAMDFHGDRSKVIHSTTDYWTIGLPKSHGCIGLKIEDMLELYGCINQVPIRIDTKYKTFEVEGDKITFYADIYQKVTTGNELAELGEQVRIPDINSASNRLGIIRQELRNNLKKVLRGLEAGKDMSSHRTDLTKTLNLSEFLEPYNPKLKILYFEVASGDGLVSCLRRCGIKKSDALEVSNHLEELGINPKKLQIGDAFRARFLEDNLESIEYEGVQGRKSLELELGRE